MKVWIVEVYGTDGRSEVIGVFSSCDRANAFAATVKYTSVAEYTVDEVPEWVEDDYEVT